MQLYFSRNLISFACLLYPIDDKIPLFCVCVLLGERETVATVEDCFNKDPSHNYTDVQNPDSRTDLDRARKRYVEDLKRVDKLGLNSKCSSKALVMNMWMKYHLGLNAIHNKIQHLPCKSYIKDQHPDFLELIIKLFMGISNKVLKGCTFDDMLKLLSPSTVSGLYDETELQCDDNKNSLACKMVRLKQIVVALQDIRKNYHDDQLRSYRNLTRLTMSLYFGQEFNLGKFYIRDKGFFESIIFLLQIFERKDIGMLKSYLKCIPDLESLNIIKGCNDVETNYKSRKCQAKTAYEGVHGYFKAYYDSKQNLNTTVIRSADYKSLLEAITDTDTHRLVLKEYFTLLDVVKTLKGYITEQLGEGFAGLRSYFTTTSDFDSKTSAADISYINSTLNKYNERVNTSKKDVGEMLGGILSLAVKAKSVQVYEKTAQLVAASVSMLNPIAAITGGASVTEVKDRADELATVAADLAKAQYFQNMLELVKQNTEQMGKELRKNQLYLENVYKLIDGVLKSKTLPSEDFESRKLSFLAKYNSYTPAVTKPDITEVMAEWEELVTEGCKLLESATGAYTEVAKAIARAVRMDKDDSTSLSKYLCYSTPIAMKKMAETYDEIYDFQFQLMDAFANYMRSMTSKKAAENIGKSFGDIKEQKVKQKSKMEDLEFVAAYSNVLYRLQELTILEEYCNFLEYTEGGKRPLECKGFETNILDLRKHEQRECLELNTGYVDIPTKPDTSNVSLSLTDIIAGKKVSIQVPDSEWLVTNEWIQPLDEKSKIYVHSVALFLPISSKEVQKISVLSDFSGSNRLSPTAKLDYVLIPQTRFRYDYQVGPQVSCPPNEEIQNPYNICEDKKLGILCQLTEDVKWDSNKAYPSIFGRLEVRVYGYKDHKMSLPVTYLPVKAFLKYCVISDSQQPAAPAGPEMESFMCCDKNEYFSRKASSCEPCPSGSTSKLNGYYCGKDSTKSLKN